MTGRPRHIELVCACCGNPFRATRQDARYCSQQCTTAAYEEKVREKRKVARQAKEALGPTGPKRPAPKTRLGKRQPTQQHTCMICGKPFLAARKDARMCSVKCRNADKERKQKSIRQEKLNQKRAALKAKGLPQVASNRCGPRERKYMKCCLICDAAFSSTREDAQFCSAPCRDANKSDRNHAKHLEKMTAEQAARPASVKARTHELVCTFCNNAFFASRPDAKFCSATCRQESYLHVRHLRRMAKLPPKNKAVKQKDVPPPTHPTTPPTTPAATSHTAQLPLVIEQTLVDLPTLCYLTSISRSAMYRLLQDCPDFPVLKVKGSTRFPRDAAIRYLIERFSVNEAAVNVPSQRAP